MKKTKLLFVARMFFISLAITGFLFGVTSNSGVFAQDGAVSLGSDDLCYGIDVLPGDPMYQESCIRSCNSIFTFCFADKSLSSFFVGQVIKLAGWIAGIALLALSIFKAFRLSKSTKDKKGHKTKKKRLLITIVATFAVPIILWTISYLLT